MKNTFSRNCTLFAAVLFFVCVSDHFLLAVLPSFLKMAGKTVGKVYKTVSEIERVVRHI